MLSVGLQSIIKRWVSCYPTLLRGAGLRGELSCPRLHGWWQNWAVANGLAPAAFQNTFCKVAKTEPVSPALDADQTTQEDHKVLERRRKYQGPSRASWVFSGRWRRRDPISWVQINKAQPEAPTAFLPHSLTTKDRLTVTATWGPVCPGGRRCTRLGCHGHMWLLRSGNEARLAAHWIFDLL